MDKNKKIFFFIIGILILGTLMTILLNKTGTVTPKDDGKYDAFAQCLKDKGAVFYGTFWCPHCQNQKKAFGSSAKMLPYVECSTPDAQNQTQICKDAEISVYPTWKFQDGSKLEGEIALPVLAEKTSCELPQ